MQPPSLNVVWVILIAVLLGASIGYGHASVTAALVIVGFTIWALSILRFPGWAILILSAAVLGRGAASILGISSLLAFAHYPLVLAWFVASLRNARPQRHTRRLIVMLLSLGALTIASAMINGTSIIRLMLFLAIMTEPFLIMASVNLHPPTSAQLSALGKWAVVIALFQVPFIIYQIAQYGWLDPVVGTLTGMGAGAHVLGGIFALGGFILLGYIRDRGRMLIPAVIGVVLALFIIVAAGAMQVLFVFLVVAAIFTIIPDARRRGSTAWWLASVVVVVGLAAGGLRFAEFVQPGITERAQTGLESAYAPVIELIGTRLRHEPVAALVGSGPGTTSSRAALLLTPSMRENEEAVLSALALEPTQEALEVSQQIEEAYRTGGSAQAISSTNLGVMGDLGLVGALLMGLLLWFVWRRLGERTPGPLPLRFAAKASLVSVIALSAIDNWLEFPELTVPLGLLVGVASVGTQQVRRTAPQPRKAGEYDSLISMRRSQGPGAATGISV